MPPIDLPEILGVPLPTEDVPDSTIHLDRHTAEDEALLLLRDFVDELETILASKATPAQITTAVSALADSTATALGGKASNADLTALATTVGGKATPADITTAVNALATSISGSYASKVLGGREKIRAVSTSGASHTVDLTLGNLHELTLTAASCAITMPTGASVADANGQSLTFTLLIKQDTTGGRLVTWPSTIRWQTAPPRLGTLAGTVDLVTFVSTDGGATWLGLPATSFPPLDVTAPSVPAGLTASPSSGQVNLAWNASTDNQTGIALYRVYRDGALVASPATNAYQDLGLTNGTSYTYRVSAVDGAGNESAQSAAVTATANPAPQTTLASDAFNRTNSTSSLGSADVGGAWDVAEGVFGISSNQAYAVSFSGNNRAIATLPTQANATVTVTFPVAGNGGLILRANSGRTQFLYLSPSGLGSFSGTAFTAIGSNFTTSFTTGDICEVVMSGTTITVKRNGSVVGTYTTSIGQTETRHGLMTFATGIRWDDFSIKTNVT